MFHVAVFSKLCGRDWLETNFDRRSRDSDMYHTDCSQTEAALTLVNALGVVDLQYDRLPRGD